MTEKRQRAVSKRTKRGYGGKLIWGANNLSEEKLKHADETAPNPEGLMEFLLEAVDAGIDIKVGWDDYSNCYQATAVGAWEDFPSAGYAVSARSNRDCYDALVLVYYKVAVMAGGDLSSLPSDRQIDDLRG